jgi:hypothetical protein
MKKRPIIFSGPMVRAILDGRKTQTRRVIRGAHGAASIYAGNRDGLWVIQRFGDAAQAVIRCPYGCPGDRLWVKETFCLECSYEVGGYPPPFRDGRPIKYYGGDGGWQWWKQPHYRATDPTPDLDIGTGDPGVIWRPSMFMPRWASRIMLEITAIRADRLQDISVEDTWAEGVLPGRGDAVAAFADLWDRINGKRGYGWDANPWVWVVEFRKIEVQA